MKANILAIDDVAINLQILGKILNDAGYKTFFSQSGTQIIEQKKLPKYDLILLDIMMPDMDGFEVCEKLKQREDTKDIPIIFLTAKDDEASLQKGFSLGGVDYITKPFNAKELLARVDTHLTLRSHQKKIEQQNKRIKRSVKYAYQIQKALLPTTECVDKLFKNYFILNMPRDIVSGDFYWVKKKDGYKFCAVADCTGHGVPAAFLSVLGISLLNEITSRYIEQNIPIQSNMVLHELRAKVKESLKQKDMAGDMTDSFDMAFCIYDEKRKELQYSGANVPLYLFRDNELQIYNPVHSPVGIYFKELEYTNEIIKVEKGDTIYLFSDGFIDQFGGEEHKKLNYQAFRDILLAIHKSPFRKQQEILTKYVTEWIGEGEQTDDILIMGFHLE